ncbi:MAG: hypothetical protein IKB04_01950 [Clostridia bacterium]|nr:hypothetical protein [Clostridia bacterium]
MARLKKYVSIVLVLLIIFTLSSCSYSAPIDQFLNMRVVSESPQLYFDMGEYYVGELLLEDGTVQKVELRISHGMFLVIEFRADHYYGSDDKVFYRGPYTVKGDTLILKDNDSGIKIHLKSQGIEPKEHYYLSYIMKHSIVENYFSACWNTEFEDGETVPYEKVFQYFFYEGIMTFDQKRLSDIVYPYYDSDTGKFAIPHRIVDEYLEHKFPTTASPQQIDMWVDEFYNSETLCYEYEKPQYDWAGVEIDIDYDNIELRDNVFEFKARYFHPDAAPEATVICGTFVVELSRDNYKILSFKKTEEEPTGRIVALRRYYMDTGDGSVVS